MSTKVYLVDDYARMRDMLRDLIDELPGLSVCGVAGSAESALQELPGLDADVALIDLSLPQMGGIELVSVLREQLPELRCLVMSGHNEPSYVQRALAAGAQGYLLKGSALEIEPAISAALAGEQYLSAELRTLASPGQ